MKARSLLFVPGHRDDFVAKAHRSAADIIIVDLEDGVAAADKERARRSLNHSIAHLKAHGLCHVAVRINPLEAGGRTDAALAVDAGASSVMLPKVEHPRDIEALAQALRYAEGFKRADEDRVRIIALIETAEGLFEAREIAWASPGRLIALAFGGEDLAAQVGSAPTPRFLSGPAQHVVLAAAAAGKPAYGLVGSISDIAALQRFQRAARLAAAYGFAGAMCISPKQLAIVNDVFAPSEAEVAWAEAVVAKASVADGASLLNGQMIDPPIVARANRILERQASRPRM